jgi:SAM domain (Sterile alpha motif)
MPREEASAGILSEAEHWLEDIGLGRYADLFAQNRIDLDVLPDLTEADLAELGLPLGDRKRLLRAMASLADASVASRSAPIHRISVARPAAERRQLSVMFCAT